MESDFDAIANQILTRLNRLAAELSQQAIQDIHQKLFSTGDFDSLFALRTLLILETEFDLIDSKYIQHIHDIDSISKMAQIVVVSSK